MPEPLYKRGPYKRASNQLGLEAFSDPIPRRLRIQIQLLHRLAAPGVLDRNLGVFRRRFRAFEKLAHCFSHGRAL